MAQRQRDPLEARRLRAAVLFAVGVRQAEVEQALLEGATANGFTAELWTLGRITLVIERLTGVRHHPAHV